MQDHLNNHQLLDLVALAALHSVPCSVCEDAADSPHDRDRSLECAWVMLESHWYWNDGVVRRTGLLDLPGHLDDACSAACGGRRVEADEGARGAGGNAGEHVESVGFGIVCCRSWKTVEIGMCR